MHQAGWCYLQERSAYHKAASREGVFVGEAFAAFSVIYEIPVVVFRSNGAPYIRHPFGVSLNEPRIRYFLNTGPALRGHFDLLCLPEVSRKLFKTASESFSFTDSRLLNGFRKRSTFPKSMYLPRSGNEPELSLGTNYP